MHIWLGFPLATDVSTSLASIDAVLGFFNDLVLDVVTNFVPRVSSSGKTRLPWWTPECPAVSRVKKQTYHHWLRSRSQADWIEHKRGSAVARRTLRFTRRSSWRRYVSSLRMDVSPSVVWSRVRKISRRYEDHLPHLLDVVCVLSASPLEVGTALGLELARHSNCASYSPNFSALRAADESLPLC